MNKRNVIIGLFILLTAFGFFLRFYQLSTIPASISHDELDNVVNGLGILYTGMDLQGQHYFWQLYPVRTHTYTAELSALWHIIPPQLPVSLVTLAKMPNSIAGIIFSMAFGYFAYLIFKKRQIASIVFLLILLSPWHILISRTAYEAPIALMFLILSMIFFWLLPAEQSLYKKIGYLLLTAVCMLFSFYTYHGYKLVLPFIYIVLFFWHYKTSRNKNIIFLVTILIIWLAAFSLFGIRVKEGDYGSRTNEISILNSSDFSQEVDIKRKMSLDNTFTPLFENKISVLAEQQMSSLLQSFDPVVLFISGFDKGSMIGLWQYGFLYIIQLTLLFFGFLWLRKHALRDGVYLLLLMFISLIPTLLHVGTSIVLRSNIFIPVIIIFSGLGIYQLLFEKYRFKNIAVGGFILITVYSLMSFQFYYFVRYPIQNIDSFFFNDRMLANYVLRINTTDLPIIIFSDEPFNTMRIVAYYDRLITPATIHQWQKVLNNPNKNKYSYNNLIITKDCNDVHFSGKKNSIIASPNLTKKCKLDAAYATSSASLNKKIVILTSPRDNLTYYRIYNDSLCNTNELAAYIQIKNRSLLDVENLSNTDFCQHWISKIL
jgi:hypothetical protein